MKILIDLKEIPVCDLIHFHNVMVRKLGEDHETPKQIREFLSKDKQWTIKYFNRNKQIRADSIPLVKYIE